MMTLNQRLICGDCREVLPTMPEGSVHCVVTSPPYFALRSYLDKGHPDKGKEIGSELTPEAFIETMVRVFREVRRVLRDDGVLFLNMGDSMSAGGRKGHGTRIGYKQESNGGSLAATDIPRPNGFPGGNLLNIPHRVAGALRADGWIWRQTIVWAKRSPMPESVNGWRWQRCRVKMGDAPREHKGHERLQGARDDIDGKSFASQAQWSECPGCPKCEKTGGYVLRRGSGRCTTAHEYVFILTKTNCYFWDSEQSKEVDLGQDHPRKVLTGQASLDPSGGLLSPIKGIRTAEGRNGNGRNSRSVWTLSSEPTSEHHFATFPSELVHRCLKAGASGGGCCPECGAPWAPVIESDRVPTRPALNNKIWKHDDSDPIGQRSKASPNLDPERHVKETQCLGYRPTCVHVHDKGSPCTIMDPFAGIGTVAQVARHMGHKSISIELNPKYVEIAKKRIQETPRCFIRMGEEQSIEPEMLLFAAKQGA